MAGAFYLVIGGVDGHMVKLIGERIYLAALEREHCMKLWDDFEYDFEMLTEPLNIGHSSEKAEAWFDEIQRDQGNRHIRLGVFLPDGTVIGDVALQDIDWRNRSCSIGLGIPKKKIPIQGIWIGGCEDYVGLRF